MDARLSPMRKREPRGIGEAGRGSVNDFGEQSQRLQSARSEAFDEQGRGKITKFAFMRNGQDRAKAFQIDNFRANVMVSQHRQLS